MRFSFEASLKHLLFAGENAISETHRLVGVKRKSLKDVKTQGPGWSSIRDDPTANESGIDSMGVNCQQLDAHTGVCVSKERRSL